MPLPDGNGFILDAGMNIGDVSEQLNIDLPSAESDTLGGFIYDQLGKVPVEGERVTWGEWLMEVLAVNDRRILKVKVTHAPPEQDTRVQTQEQPDQQEAQPDQHDQARKPDRQTNGAANSASG